jgi:RsiG-like
MAERRLLDQILAPDFLEGISDRSLEEIREMRARCNEVETEVSYERRLCQARVDILKAELDRREGKGDGDLITRLPHVLVGEAEQPSERLPIPNRAPHLSIPRSADVVRRRADDVLADHNLSNLPQLSRQEIEEMLRKLAEREQMLSDGRRRVHEVVDAVQSELVRRYKSGQADPTSALS